MDREDYLKRIKHVERNYCEIDIPVLLDETMIDSWDEIEIYYYDRGLNQMLKIVQ